MAETHTVVLAGVGGSGVVLGGTLLARAGAKQFPFVTRFPNFTTAMRGGACECMVILSTQEIASSLVAQGDALLIMENSQLIPFSDRVRPGGLVILESAGLKDKFPRGDVKVIPIPAMEIAAALGDTLISNLVLLGVYLGAHPVFPPELLEKELESRLGVSETGIRAVERQSRFQLNLEAFRRGLALGKKGGG